MVMQEILRALTSGQLEDVEEAQNAEPLTKPPTPTRQGSGFVSAVSDWTRDSPVRSGDEAGGLWGGNDVEDDDFDEDDDDFGWYNEADGGRLSRSLKQWLPDYKIRSLTPQPNPPRQPVFSARLGDHMKIKRSDSSESIDTQLSLFSCSSHGSRVSASTQRRRRRRKKQEEEAAPSGPSIWIQLANKRSGQLDKMMNMHAMYAQLETETEIFRHLPEEERVMVTKAGYCRGVHLGPGFQRSDSCSNVYKKLPVKKKKVQRMQSAGGKHEGPMINFHEMKKQMMAQKLAVLNQQHRHRHSSRRSIGARSISHLSLTSAGSNEAMVSNTPRNTSPLQEDDEKEAALNVWKGDSQILAIDLKRELTAKVKSKIASTAIALERVTGFGDDNQPRTFVGPLEEYPALVEENYSHMAKIPQRVRISPQLSQVIRTDIHVRMGRPRYHEIRVKDLKLWNRGHSLDRAHRNLKVFNWLHSLREADFDMSLPENVEDEICDQKITSRDEVIVSVDDPKIKPLFERLKHAYIV